MKRMMMAAALFLAVSIASAQDDTDTDARFRVGVAAAFSDYKGDPTLPISDSALGVQLYAQAKLNSWFGVEGGYFSSGEFETNLSPNSTTCNPDEFCDAGVEFKGFSLTAVGYLPIGGDDSDIDFYGKIGAYNFDIEMNQRIGSSTVPGSLGSSSGLTAGAGAVINVGDNIGVRTEFDYYDVENTEHLWTLAMGLEYRF
jgi:opacity protein-like surface antigen